MNPPFISLQFLPHLGTRHLIDAAALAQMNPGVLLINAGRGARIETQYLVTALKARSDRRAGRDVYEEEEGVFFHDVSHQVLQDDELARMLTFPNTLVTSHQGFLTPDALANIADTTLGNVRAFERGEALDNHGLRRRCNGSTALTASDPRQERVLTGVTGQRDGCQGGAELSPRPMKADVWAVSGPGSQHID